MTTLSLPVISAAHVASPITTQLSAVVAPAAALLPKITFLVPVVKTTAAPDPTATLSLIAAF